MLLVVVGGGVALAAVAGARRTQTAMPRFLAYNRPEDAMLFFNASPPVVARVLAQPQVAQAMRLPYLYMSADRSGLAGSAAVFGAADIVVQVLCYGSNDITGKQDLPLLRRRQVLIGFLRPLGSAEAMQEIASAGVTAFSVEMVPRTTRAQSMDALSSMGTICGYKAVLEAADKLPRIFPMLTTAAGTITPARVFVIGAGVAGLQAIATARRLGAVASAYDMRPAAKEQVQSLGGRFIELPIEAKDAQDARGYGTAQDESFYQRQRELLGRVVKESDVVITAAVIPGKKSPVLVTEEMVKGMAPGSVIFDLAGERGGNCELTETGKAVVRHGVTIIGAINLATNSFNGMFVSSAE